MNVTVFQYITIAYTKLHIQPDIVFFQRLYRNRFIVSINSLWLINANEIVILAAKYYLDLKVEIMEQHYIMVLIVAVLY